MRGGTGGMGKGDESGAFSAEASGTGAAGAGRGAVCARMAGGSSTSAAAAINATLPCPARNLMLGYVGRAGCREKFGIFGMADLLIFGLGFSGVAVAQAALDAGIKVVATSRQPEKCAAPKGVRLRGFEAAEESLLEATHVLATAPPGAEGDPVLARYGAVLRRAENIFWLGYLSTTGVYGNRDGGWVDEASEPAPGSDRSRRRLAAEEAWREVAGQRPLDIFRLAGIYGPGRSALDDVRSGRARRVLAPGHAFGRIHVADIAGGVLAATARPPQGTRVLNFSDDVPTESAAVIEEAARLLGAPVPPGIELEKAWPGMSEMARSFWAENRRVRSEATQKMLGRSWKYPSFREGLRAILEQERANDIA
jgi:nucleoside-diphosphate-sugar epimerase